jgi:hypothetical protein
MGSMVGMLFLHLIQIWPEDGTGNQKPQQKSAGTPLHQRNTIINKTIVNPAFNPTGVQHPKGLLGK